MFKQFVKVCEHFNRQIDMFMNPKPGAILKLLLFLDMVAAFVIHGAGRTDYIYFEFWKKTHLERHTFLTRRRFNKMINKYNDRNRSDLFRNKHEFNRVFSKYLNRSWLDVGQCSFEEFQVFVSKHTAAVVKPIRGFEGRGIYQLDLPRKDIEQKALFDNLRGAGAIMEEIITPGVLSEFNPSSVNSIRVGTLLTGKDTSIKFASIKMGNGDVFIDNYALGGIHAVIDIDTGIVITQGSDIDKHRYIQHPISGKQILGYQIPEWKRIVDTVKMASRIIPEVRYVGWDVTFDSAGEVVIIEGNEESCRTFQALDQVGRRHLFLA